MNSGPIEQREANEAALTAEMIAILRRTYCHTLGVEFMHISDPAAKAWIQERKRAPRGNISKPDVYLRKTRPVRAGSNQA